MVPSGYMFTILYFYLLFQSMLTYLVFTSLFMGHFSFVFGLISCRFVQ